MESQSGSSPAPAPADSGDAGHSDVGHAGTAYGWFVMAAFAAVALANQYLWLTFAPVTDASARYYGVSVSAIGWLANVFPLAYIVLALPAGALLDRWFRPSLALGAALSGIGALLRVGGHLSFAYVEIGQASVAVAQPLILNSVTKLAGQYLPGNRRTEGISLGSAGLFVGMVLALLLGAILGGGEIASLVDVGAVLGLVSAVVLMVGLRQPGGFGSGDRVLEAGSVTHSIKEIFKIPAYRQLVGLVAVGFGIFIALATWLEPLMVNLGLSSTVGGLALLAMVVAGVVGAAVLPAPLLRHNMSRVGFAVSIAITAVGCVALGLAHGPVVDIVTSSLIGLVLLTDLPLILELTERVAGQLGGTAIAVIWLVGNAGGLVAAAVVDLLLGQPTTAFLVLAVMTLLGVPVLRRMVAG
jgi:predicted MFS family arabinose efflux permease